MLPGAGCAKTERLEPSSATPMTDVPMALRILISRPPPGGQSAVCARAFGRAPLRGYALFQGLLLAGPYARSPCRATGQRARQFGSPVQGVFATRGLGRGGGPARPLTGAGWSVGPTLPA